MKILNAKELNEKMNIQPVSKERLNQSVSNLYKLSRKYAVNFKTGDIVFLGTRAEQKRGIFISHNDILHHIYDDMLDVMKNVMNYDD